MIDITFDMSGMDGFEEKAREAMLQMVKDHVSRELGQVRCPVHHEAPEVRFGKPGLDEEEIEIGVTFETCCGEMDKILKDRFGEKSE